ncbi:MAG: carboxypeptidase-like regulatory domain-containing protein, partial [Bryobacteraceae bacterium]
MRKSQNGVDPSIGIKKREVSPMLQIRRAPIAVTARLMLTFSGMLQTIMVLTFLAGSLAGQVTTATLYGTIIDPSGAGIPDATIIVTNEGTQSVS